MTRTLSRDEQLHLAELVMPYVISRQREIKESGQRFVYYTSGEGALNIIRSKEIWLRHAGSMNDFLEIEFGIDRLSSALLSERGRQFQATLDRVHDGTSEYVLSNLHSSVPHFRFYTYMFCVSEHLDREDAHGRLSMWRAYGGDTSVAIVLNSAVFFNESRILRAFSSPVAYWSTERYEEEMERVARNIDENLDLFRSLSPEQFRLLIFNVCRFGVLCSKHPGFREEREWRVVYSPTFERSPVVQQDIVSIAGTPQKVYKIPLRDFPDEGLVGAELPALVDRIIVGPTHFPIVIADALVEELREAGVPDANERIAISDIPLRR